MLKSTYSKNILLFLGAMVCLFLFMVIFAGDSSAQSYTVTRGNSITVTLNIPSSFLKDRVIYERGSSGFTDHDIMTSGPCRGPYTYEDRNRGTTISGNRITLTNTDGDGLGKTTEIEYLVRGTTTITRSVAKNYAGEYYTASHEANCAENGTITVKLNYPPRPSSVPASQAHLSHTKYRSAPTSSSGCTLLAEGNGSAYGVTDCLSGEDLQRIASERNITVSDLPTCPSGEVPTEPCKARGGWTPYD